MDREDRDHLSLRSARRICNLALSAIAMRPEVLRTADMNYNHHRVAEELPDTFFEMEDGGPGMPIEQLVGFVLSLSEIVDEADDRGEPVDTNRYIGQCREIIGALRDRGAS